MINVRAKAPKCTHAVTAAAIFLSLSSGAMAQFYATIDEDGGTTVFDTSDQEVPIATADPVGTRPLDCPSGAYYASEAQSDKTELILTDCASGQNQYTVEMQGLTDTPSE